MNLQIEVQHLILKKSYDWLDLQIADRERKVQRVQDLLTWAKRKQKKNLRSFKLKIEK